MLRSSMFGGCGLWVHCECFFDSYLFTESNLKQFPPNRPHAGSPRLGPESFSIMRIYLLLPAVFPERADPYSGYCSPSAHYVSHVLVKVFYPYAIYFL